MLELSAMLERAALPLPRLWEPRWRRVVSLWNRVRTVDLHAPDPLHVLTMPSAPAQLLEAALERALREGGYLTAEHLAKRLELLTADTRARTAQHLFAEVERAFGRESAWEPRAAAPIPLAESDLVAHNAEIAAERGGTSALNRYLQRQGLPRCQRTRGTGPWLSSLAFELTAAVDQPELVSVVMSAHNAAPTIPYAVDSMLRQSYRNLELLVCDDASTDGTWELLQKRYAGHGRVRLFRSRVKQGAYNVRNAMVPLTRGAYVTFQDADDVSLPVRIERQVRAMSDSTQACIANWLRIRADGSVVFFWDQRALRMSLVSLLVRREALLSVMPYPSARFGADLDIYRLLRLRFGADSVARLRESLLLGLWSDGSLTRAPGAEALESGYRSPARREYSELLFQRDLRGEDAIDRTVIDAMLAATGNQIAPSSLGLPPALRTGVEE